MAKIVTGGAGNDNLKGSWDEDFIDGGGGADIMSGGGGNDVYIVNHAGDVVRESPSFPIYNDTAVRMASITGAGIIGNADSGGNALAVSASGQYVVFFSNANNLVSPDTNADHDIFVKDMTSGSVQFVHTNSDNMQPLPTQGGGPAPDYSAIRMTPDGRYVVFNSSSVGLVPEDTTTDIDIFVKDLVTGTITIESQPVGGGVQDYHTFAPDITSDGRFVVFTAMDNLVAAGDDNGAADTDVYWKDRETGQLVLISGNFDGSVQGSSDSSNATVSDDGRYVLFQSDADNFLAGDTNESTDLYVRDLDNGSFYLITRDFNGLLANSSSYDGKITPDAQYAVFTSAASDLVTGDTNGAADIFRVNLETGEQIRVNTKANGAQAGGGQHAQITPDGRYVVFESPDTTYVTVAGDSNAITKIFVKDLVTGQIEMVSRTSTGAAIGYDAFAPEISANGQYIVFNTSADLNSQDSGSENDVYRVPNPLYSPGDEVRASVSYTLPTDVENLLLTGSAPINGTGNAQKNVIAGNDGNNTLDGGGGNDVLNGAGGNDMLIGGVGNDNMAGGTGNDTYVRNAAGDVVTEQENAGIDTVQSAVTYTLGANLENLTLTGTTAINGVGNTLNNTLVGNTGKNNLNGGDGIDVLRGLAGADVLIGGAGADKFDFDSAGDTGTSAASRDKINDFVRGTDKIDLSTIDANGAGAGNGAFKFIGASAFSANATGQLRFDAANHVLLGSTDADSAAEFSILLPNINAMAGSDFIL